MVAFVAQILAGICGLLGVGFGAFGAHGLTDPQAKAWAATGATYGLVHAVAALWAAAQSPWLALLWVTGALVFSGSLYALAMGLPRGLAAFAPIGGGLMIVGWAYLLVLLVTRLR